MNRYFIIEEVTKEKFDKIQAELGTNLSLDEDEDTGEVATWSHGRNIDGFGVVPLIVDDYYCDELPAVSFDNFDKELVEREDE